MTPTHAELREKATALLTTREAYDRDTGRDHLVTAKLLVAFDEACESFELTPEDLLAILDELDAANARIAALEAQVAEAREIVEVAQYHSNNDGSPTSVSTKAKAWLKALREKAPKGAAGVK